MPAWICKEVLLRFSWLIRVEFQAEFSAEKENTNSVMFEDTNASRRGLYGLESTVESLSRSVADG